MDAAAVIIQEIKNCIGTGQYNSWVIGITSDPSAKKQALDSPPCWKAWAAETNAAAKKIVHYFLKEYPRGPASGRIEKGESEISSDQMIPYVYIC